MSTKTISLASLPTMPPVEPGSFNSFFNATVYPGSTMDKPVYHAPSCVVDGVHSFYECHRAGDLRAAAQVAAHRASDAAKAAVLSTGGLQTAAEGAGDEAYEASLIASGAVVTITASYRGELI